MGEEEEEKEEPHPAPFLFTALAHPFALCLVFTSESVFICLYGAPVLFGRSAWVGLRVFLDLPCQVPREN